MILVQTLPSQNCTKQLMQLTASILTLITTVISGVHCCCPSRSNRVRWSCTTY